MRKSISKNTQFDLPIASKALEDLLDLGGFSLSPRLEFSGGDICFNSPFYCAEAGSAVLAAMGLAAIEIKNKTQDRNQLEDQLQDQLSVNTRLAEASLISFALQNFTDEKKAPELRPPPSDRTPASGFFKCKDGRVIYLHSSFPHYSQHSDAMLKLLNAAPSRDAIAHEIAKISAKELEDKIASAGLCGAMLRSAQEWDLSSAGQALSAVPVIEIIKMTETNPQTTFNSKTHSPPAGSALEGLKVLDLTRVLAGPSCAKSLGSFGADVLHIRGQGLPYVESFVVDTGIGKRSAFLNLKEENDRDVLRTLVKQSDVFSQGYRSGVMDKFGFSAEDVMALNPNSIYVSINCYGHAGAWQKRPGWEQLAQVWRSNKVTILAKAISAKAAASLIPNYSHRL